MQKYSPYEYIKIAIANSYGLDKLTWKERIAWVDTQLADHTPIINNVADAKEPFQFLKACNALSDAEQGIPTGYIMGLDATASGLQIMACLIGCHKTAANVNLIDIGSRVDVYDKTASEMDKICSGTVDRDLIKQPLK